MRGEKPGFRRKKVRTSSTVMRSFGFGRCQMLHIRHRQSQVHVTMRVSLKGAGFEIVTGSYPVSGRTLAERRR